MNCTDYTHNNYNNNENDNEYCQKKIQTIQKKIGIKFFWKKTNNKSKMNF